MANIIKIILPDGSTYDVGNSLCLGINNQTWNAQETQFTGTLDYTETEIHELVTNGTFVWFQYFDSLEDDIVMLFPYGDNFWMDLGYSRRGYLTNSGITVNVAPGFAALSSPAFSGTPTAPTPSILDNGTQIATTAFVHNVMDSLKNIKIYYALIDSGYGSWSGQDFSTFNFSYRYIYTNKTVSSSTLITSTEVFLEDLENGIIPVIWLLDQYDCPVYAFPSLVGDDNSYMYFYAPVSDGNGGFVLLTIDVDINSVTNFCNGLYLVNSGGGSNLPTVTSSDYNKYLHTNTSTGALEWSTVSSQLPSVSSSDNGKFLRVVSGAWAAATIPDANGVSF